MNFSKPAGRTLRWAAGRRKTNLLSPDGVFCKLGLHHMILGNICWEASQLDVMCPKKKTPTAVWIIFWWLWVLSSHKSRGMSHMWCKTQLWQLQCWDFIWFYLWDKTSVQSREMNAQKSRNKNEHLLCCPQCSSLFRPFRPLHAFILKNECVHVVWMKLIAVC